MKIAIYSKALDENYLPFVVSLLENMEKEGMEVVVYESFFDFLEKRVALSSLLKVFSNHNDIESVDYLFSIGGDGTILEAVTLVRDNAIPILGINTGRLGFLSSISTDEIDVAMAAIVQKDFLSDKRNLLSLETPSNLFGDLNFALNEITVQKQDTSSMITIHTYLDGVFLNSYWADGIIISTPTGSTAYSLSCNGPIVLPGSGNMVITPIAPHNLNVRPLVIPDDKELTLKVEGRMENFLVTLDSRSLITPANVNLKIKKCAHEINLIRLNEHSFLKTLREKLMWGIDKRN